MNRLTEWTGEGWIAKQEKINGKRIGDKDIYAKLAAYEDTGLEPEQIKSFLKDFGISVVMKNTKLMNELKEYKDLEEQGLLIKLPCKVGDTVYKIKATFSYFSKPIEDRIGLIKIYKDEILYTCTSGIKFSTDAVGKTVFLTREEAEKALAEAEK